MRYLWPKTFLPIRISNATGGFLPISYEKNDSVSGTGGLPQNISSLMIRSIDKTLFIYLVIHV